MKNLTTIFTVRNKVVLLAIACMLIVLMITLTQASLAHANPTTGTVMADILPSCSTGNGRGLAFDGSSLYYTIVNDPNIYMIDTLGNCLGTISLPLGDLRVSRGGPLAFDGNNLWTMDYSLQSFTVYQVNPITGSTLYSCNIATQNPTHPAVVTYPINIGEDTDGLSWTGSTLWISSEVFAGNWVVEIDTSCNILNAFNPPVVNGHGTSGVEFVGGKLWHSNAHFVQYETDVSGVQTGISFNNTYQLEDLAFDDVTFAPVCVLWANQASSGPNHIIAYEIPCPNQPPTADPNGPYVFPRDAGPFSGTGSSDPDGDPLTYDWEWGDGSSSLDAGAIPIHTYAEAGIYDVCLTVNDGYVDSEQDCTITVVYDPSAGFVTGGGWIYSAAGAYVPDSQLEGKANFGFVSKYQKSAKVPSGNTQFQFQTADLNFHSDSYEWLVVTGSNYAKFKGEGTINGALDSNGNAYKFMIWAGDGTGTDSTDTFRIKIWQEDESGVETVIYDNGSDQVIGSGSIVVHEKD